ncbi:MULTISPECIES: cytidine deaminase [Halomonas]|uniref:Cytidine deaminase n=1 Tax=Halomonas chromatireducens TaxID=507626 RepID=A0A0X8HDU4_9GAMM|nr:MULTISPECIES: cytidine deaminase [Halomonas]AMD00764.1 Cytidine deaminase [Halomonas chromatireducens]MBZ0330919.1 cytidine deaminase [Halomonas sp. ANAO-440]
MSDIDRTIDPATVAALIVARGNAYAPYSQHPVGAMVESESGARYFGANVEVAHYKGLCAEASAIAAMVSAGERRLRSVYVIGPGEHLCSPCGDCRQRIREFADAETRIYVVDAEGRLLKGYTIEALLPDAFGPENLSH